MPQDLTQKRRTKIEALSIGAQAAGAVAVGALAVGALAVGALAIGRLMIGRTKLRTRAHEFAIWVLRQRRLLWLKLVQIVREAFLQPRATVNV